jgi:hypothetical protein
VPILIRVIRLSFFLALLAAVFVVITGPTPVEAKSVGYVVTGGELGNHAALVYTDYWMANPNDEAVLVTPLSSPPAGLSYILYTNYFFEASAELKSGKPLAIYYADARLSYLPATGQWLRVSRDAAAAFDQALASARIEQERGRLSTDVIYAALLPDLTYGTVIITGPEEAFRVQVEDFPLLDLADSLSGGPAAAPPDSVALMYSAHKIYGTLPNGGGPIPLFRYHPPANGRPGLIWPVNTTDIRVWTTTPNFDLAFTAMPRVPLVRTALERAALRLPASQAATAPSADPDYSKNSDSRLRESETVAAVLLLGLGLVFARAVTRRSHSTAI